MEDTTWIHHPASARAELRGLGREDARVEQTVISKGIFIVALLNVERVRVDQSQRDVYQARKKR